MTQLDLVPETYSGPVHYFASCVFGWATAETRDEAIRKLIDDNRRDYTTMVKNSHKAGEPGAYVWSCEVCAASDAKYGIEFYAPKIDWRDALHSYVTYLTAKEIQYFSTKEAI